MAVSTGRAGSCLGDPHAALTLLCPHQAKRGWGPRRHQGLHGPGPPHTARRGAPAAEGSRAGTPGSGLAGKSPGVCDPRGLSLDLVRLCTLLRDVCPLSQWGRGILDCLPAEGLNSPRPLLSKTMTPARRPDEGLCLGTSDSPLPLAHGDLGAQDPWEVGLGAQ